MNIEWEQKDPSAQIFDGTTDTKFITQIAPSTEQGEFVWVVFHENSSFAQWGGSESSIENSQKASSQWLEENYKTWMVTNPKND